MVLLGLVLALAAPRLGVVPTGVQLTQLQDSLEEACRTASNLALALDRPVAVTLDTKGHCLWVRPVAAAAVDAEGEAGGTVPAPVAPAGPGSGTGATSASSATAAMAVPAVFADLPPALLPAGLTVQVDEPSERGAASAAPTGGEAAWSYTFYPDGEAAGPRLHLRLRGQALRLAVDALTGRPEVLRE